jgi:hypothetical protein
VPLFAVYVSCCCGGWGHLDEALAGGSWWLLS